MNTRFNPTVNGPLHVGHLYVILLNWHQARSTGGKFIVRFDDDQPYWYDRLTSEQIKQFAEWIVEDLSWLGIQSDGYTSERAARQANERFIWERLPDPEFIINDRYTPDVRYLTVAKSIERPYPYTSYLTGVKVAQDYAEGIDTLIRGEDLLTEFSLYSYFCDVAKIRRPLFQYVPRMTRNTAPFGQPVLTDLAEVSKTQGGYAIRTYREAGWTPERLIQTVTESALKDPAGPWTFENVKTQPVLRSNP